MKEMLHVELQLAKDYALTNLDYTLTFHMHNKKE